MPVPLPEPTKEELQEYHEKLLADFKEHDEPYLATRPRTDAASWAHQQLQVVSAAYENKHPSKHIVDLLWQRLAEAERICDLIDNHARLDDRFQ